jgi:hypothetical protein
MNRERVSKRILGFFSFILGMAMAAVSGFDWYTVDATVIGIVLGYSATLLGIDAWKATKAVDS